MVRHATRLGKRDKQVRMGTESETQQQSEAQELRRQQTDLPLHTGTLQVVHLDGPEHTGNDVPQFYDQPVPFPGYSGVDRAGAIQHAAHNPELKKYNQVPQ